MFTENYTLGSFQVRGLSFHYRFHLHLFCQVVRMLTVEGGSEALICASIYEAILSIQKQFQWHKIQDPASPNCESQMSTRPQKKSRHLPLLCFNKTTNGINSPRPPPWLPRLAMSPQWFPWRQNTMKTASVCLWESQKRAWMFMNLARSLCCQLQRGVWGASPKALFQISLWWEGHSVNHRWSAGLLSFLFSWRLSELSPLKIKFFCVCTVRGSLVINNYLW